MTALRLLLSTGLFFACETLTIPAGRVTGVVVTEEGKPIADAFVDLYMSVPVGFEGSPVEPLGTARTRADGTYAIDFPEQHVRVNQGERMRYGLHVLHPDWLPVMEIFWEIVSEPSRFPLLPLPPGFDRVAADCRFLCGSRNRDPCRDVSKLYFGSEDACDGRY